MAPRIPALFWISCGFAFLLLQGTAAADLVRLKSGGEVRGEFERKAVQTETAEVTVRTLTGGIIIIEQTEIEFVARRPLVLEEYETRRKRTPETIDDLWELTEWCRQRGLTSERETHLLAILDLDPNHIGAHRGLGHIQRNGEWTTRDEIMRAEGYVKYKGRYVLPQELELIQQIEEQSEAEKSWFKRVYVLKRWLQGTDDQRRIAACQELEAIDDPHAVPALVKSFKDDPNEPVRLLLVKVLAKLKGEKAFEALVEQSLLDVSETVRQSALDAIPPDAKPVAIPYYANALKNPLNYVVLRAAVALRNIGDVQVVPNLIDALVTTHRYRVRVAEQDGVSIGLAPGTMVLPPEVEAMLRTGQLPYGFHYIDGSPPPPVRIRTVTIKHDHKNVEVLETLRQLTGQDYGYDERTWRLWWASTKK